jgi:protein SCO1/2
MRRHPTLALAWAAILGLSLGACGKGAPGQAAAPAAAGRDYAAHGIIRGFQSDNKVVVIEHQAIPGLMEGMTMGFELKPPALGQRLKAGDKVDFTLNVAGDDWSVTALSKTAL